MNIRPLVGLILIQNFLVVSLHNNQTFPGVKLVKPGYRLNLYQGCARLCQAREHFCVKSAILNFFRFQIENTPHMKHCSTNILAKCFFTTLTCLILPILNKYKASRSYNSDLKFPSGELYIIVRHNLA